jgi:hypothetical protein
MENKEGIFYEAWTETDKGLVYDPYPFKVYRDNEIVAVGGSQKDAEVGASIVDSAAWIARFH